MDYELIVCSLCWKNDNFIWNLQPRYVVNRVTAGDYDCPRQVLKFMTDLHAAFRMLNLRNDFLRKKFDGMVLVCCSSYIISLIPPLKHFKNYFISMLLVEDYLFYSLLTYQSLPIYMNLLIILDGFLLSCFQNE